MNDFSGRTGVALVVGGSGGLGLPIARMLAKRGSHVAVTYRSDAAAGAAGGLLGPRLGRPRLGVPAGPHVRRGRGPGRRRGGRGVRRPAHAGVRRRAARADGPPVQRGAADHGRPAAGRRRGVLQRRAPGAAAPAPRPGLHRRGHHGRDRALPGAGRALGRSEGRGRGAGAGAGRRGGTLRRPGQRRRARDAHRRHGRTADLLGRPVARGARHRPREHPAAAVRHRHRHRRGGLLPGLRPGRVHLRAEAGRGRGLRGVMRNSLAGQGIAHLARETSLAECRISLAGQGIARHSPVRVARRRHPVLSVADHVHQPAGLGQPDVLELSRGRRPAGPGCSCSRPGR